MFVDLFIQHVILMLHIVICGLSDSKIFFHSLSQTTDFRKWLLNTKFVFLFSLQLLSETFLLLRRNEQDRFINVYWPSCKIFVILAKF